MKCLALAASLVAASVPATRAATPAHEPGREYSYEWRASKTTPGARLPFLVGYPNAAVQAKVNAQIQKELDEMGCGRVPAGVRAVWKTTARVTYAAREIFSVDVVIEHDCGGPYPTNAAPAPMTFDLRTGARVRFEDLFKDNAKDKEAIARAVFAGHVTDAEVPESDKCPDRWDAATLAANPGAVLRRAGRHRGHAGLPARDGGVRLPRGSTGRAPRPVRGPERDPAPSQAVMRSL
jgi:hypothetical protein